VFFLSPRRWPARKPSKEFTEREHPMSVKLLPPKGPKPTGKPLGAPKGKPPVGAAPKGKPGQGVPPKSAPQHS
jgi:hypothetical protein